MTQPRYPAPRSDSQAIQTLTTDVAVLKTDVTYIKGSIDDLGDDVRSALTTLNAVASDPQQSALGRDLTRYIERVDRAEHDDRKRIDDLEDFRLEVRSELRSLVRITRVVAGLAALASVLVATLVGLHVLGVF